MSFVGRFAPILIAGLLLVRPASAGNVLAAASVHTSNAVGGWYDRLHVFPAAFREFSERTLYGYSIREDLGFAVRDYRVLRLKSPFAYLWISDLLLGAPLSTTSNRILFFFPRDPRPGPFLYRVLEEGNAVIRLTGPAATSLAFDAVTHRRRDAVGLVVTEPSANGAPPRVEPRTLHVRIESVGRSPFLPGTPADVVDSEGVSCRLLTDDLFAPTGAPDPDLFRWERDVEFFAFLRARCPGLRLPPLGADLVAAQTSLAERGRIESAWAAEAPIPTPAPHSARRAPRRPANVPPAPRDHGPDDGGLFEFLGGLF